MEITTDIILLLAIILFTILAFVREWLNMAVVAMVGSGLLLLSGLITPDEAISGLSNPAVVTVMMMFILSASLVHSGLVTKLGYRIAERTGTSCWKASILLLIVVEVRRSADPGLLALPPLSSQDTSPRSRSCSMRAMTISSATRFCPPSGTMMSAHRLEGSTNSRCIGRTVWVY